MVAEIAHIPERECRKIFAPDRPFRVNWQKVDRDKYSSLVTRRIKSSVSDQDTDIDLKLQWPPREAKKRSASGKMQENH